ncbi:hypothetical protein [Aquimarina macrocephali]|uniref:hypothetical protein n=1 Tax=Aquimarina macrocephali TaxID=666563 RepID=UPI0004630456|nr:hypothetical protein [Aquimarina macrocephali]
MGIFSFFKKKKNDIENFSPESKWLVEINEIEIRTVDYDGLETKLQISDISQIIIETNDTGPWGTGVWWRILGEQIILSIPGGATGESKMLESFQKFPEFNNEELIKAMSSTDNPEFLCWKMNNDCLTKAIINKGFGT